MRDVPGAATLTPATLPIIQEGIDMPEFIDVHSGFVGATGEQLKAVHPTTEVYEMTHEV